MKTMVKTHLFFQHEKTLKHKGDNITNNITGYKNNESLPYRGYKFKNEAQSPDMMVKREIVKTPLFFL